MGTYLKAAYVISGFFCGKNSEALATEEHKELKDDEKLLELALREKADEGKAFFREIFAST
jgi:hypothetical protein